MENLNSKPDLYEEVALKAQQIEDELKRLHRWQHEPLANDKFENMGAFGSKSMAFEQWIQFVLLQRIREIVNTKGEFPPESNVATYAARAFDGDADAGNLQDLLYELDQLINRKDEEPYVPYDYSKNDSYTPSTGTIPDVVYDLMDVLHKFTGDDLESQLQTFDTFISMFDEGNRKIISELFLKVAEKTSDPVAKERIRKAAHDVSQGGRAAEPYNHREAMRKFREEHKKNFPDS